MTVFVILAETDDPRLATSIASHFKDNFLKIGPGQWFVAGNGTSVDVSNLLGITAGPTKGTTDGAIVASINSYYGIASTNVWEWLKVKLSTP
jgi:hypothetical protein